MNSATAFFSALHVVLLFITTIAFQVLTLWLFFFFIIPSSSSSTVHTVLTLFFISLYNFIPPYNPCLHGPSRVWSTAGTPAFSSFGPFLPWTRPCLPFIPWSSTFLQPCSLNLFSVLTHAHIIPYSLYHFSDCLPAILWLTSSCPAWSLNSSLSFSHFPMFSFFLQGSVSYILFYTYSRRLWISSRILISAVDFRCFFTGS